MDSSTRSNHQFADALKRLPVSGVWKRFIIPDHLDRIYVQGGEFVDSRQFAADVLSKLNVQSLVTDSDLARVPRSGSVVVVCNHPFGMLEGLILIDLLSRVRPDVKILANAILAAIPEIRQSLILVDPFDTGNTARSNWRGARETISYVSGGGLLIAFPSGEVSHLQLRERRITDPDWNENISRIIRLGKATTVPLFIRGANSVAFQLMGMLHPQLRTARLLHELVNKEEKTVELRIGSPVPFSVIEELESDAKVICYLRHRTYLLENRGRSPVPIFPRFPKPSLLIRRSETVAPPVPPHSLEREIAALSPLTDAGELTVFCAKASAIPHTLNEIGRLRELSFRAVGEGTGKCADLDLFDRYYHHLFLWNAASREIVGAYRLGFTTEIIPVWGAQGLYTGSLFHFKGNFFDRIGPAIEMGRSFVRPEYQRQYGPLLALWKGIGTLVAQNPGFPVLFGPVSISNEYHPVSRRLIVRYLQAQESIGDLSTLVRPRRRFRANPRGSDHEAISLMLRDVDELSTITADIEPDGKGIPILLKQYLKLGGKLLGFNVDPDFSDALDGLILVDLRRTPPSILQRYMDREGVTKFLRYHQDVGKTPTSRTA